MNVDIVKQRQTLILILFIHLPSVCNTLIFSHFTAVSTGQASETGLKLGFTRSMECFVQVFVLNSSKPGLNPV